ncbi:glycosyltransferase [Sphingobacterium chungjuense]|uniref:glycosyltransferase n=1 Tax=Sphingobacterium chungjuense TaxID=2675553 RepID=UPI00140B3333|nr:glycosyltransferase [Sphingobacterium chungjuense]
MLSIIVSSYKDNLYSALATNIATTCGIEYELIRIDNPGIMSINSAYNQGIDKSNFEHLLFVHEDVLFETSEWGKILLSTLENVPNVGLVGLAGSTFKTKAPSGWWIDHKFQKMFITEYRNGRLIGAFNQDGLGRDFDEVVTLDGVFLASKKSLGLRFDENLSGFHNYDLAISIKSIQKKLKNIISYQINVKHFSSGNFNKDWVISTHHFYKMYKNFLPVRTQKIEEEVKFEKAKYLWFFNECFYYGKLDLCLYYAFEAFKHFPMSRLPYLMILKIIFRLPSLLKGQAQLKIK